MKKQIFLVGALVAIAMSSMFVACADKNNKEPEVINGCTCSFAYPGEATEVETISYSEMKASYGVTSCSALKGVMDNMVGDSNVKIVCNAY